MKLVAPWRKKQGKPGRIGIGMGRDYVSLVYMDQPDQVSLCQYVVAADNAELDKVLKDFVDDNGLQGTDCSLVLSPTEYQVLLVEAPNVEPEEMASALRWRIKDLLDFPVDQAAVDYFPLPDDAYRGRQKMAYVAVTQKDVLDADARRIESTGLNLDNIDIMELAINNISRQLPVEAGGCATLSLGHEHGFINMSVNGVIYLSRAIDTGWDAILYDGLDGLNRGIENPALSKLLLEVQRSLDYYESQLGKGVVTVLYLSPAGEEGELLANFLRENLLANVDLINTEKLFSFSSTVDSEDRRRCFAAVGAALGTV